MSEKSAKDYMKEREVKMDKAQHWIMNALKGVLIADAVYILEIVKQDILLGQIDWEGEEDE